MVRHCGQFRLHVLATDTIVVDWCDQHPEIMCTPVSIFLARRWWLRSEYLPGPVRGRVDELLCTWRWWFVVDLLDHVGPVTSLDADGMFWSDPEPVFAEIGAAPFAVIPHRLLPRSAGFPGVCLETHETFGLYNGGFVYLAALSHARRLAAHVHAWCYAGWRTHDDGRRTYGDQGYLELIVETLGGHVIRHLGASAAPWNLRHFPLTRNAAGLLCTGPDPLVFFHYQGFNLSQRSRPEYETADEHDAPVFEPYRVQFRAAGGA